MTRGDIMFSPCPVVRPVLRGPARRAGESIPGVHFRANMDSLAGLASPLHTCCCGGIKYRGRSLAL